MVVNFMQFMFTPQMVALKAVGFSDIVNVLSSNLLFWHFIESTAPITG